MDSMGDEKEHSRRLKLTRAARINLAEHDLLEFVIERQHTSTGNTTENVGTEIIFISFECPKHKSLYSPSPLEQRLGTFLLDDLGTSIEHGLVMHLGTRSHHHTTTGSTIRSHHLGGGAMWHIPDSVKRIRSKTRTNSNTPAEEEGGQEVAFQRSNKHNGF